jgi:hypothetical protein
MRDIRSELSALDPSAFRFELQVDSFNIYLWAHLGTRSHRSRPLLCLFLSAICLRPL